MLPRKSFQNNETNQILDNDRHILKYLNSIKLTLQNLLSILITLYNVAIKAV